MAEPIDYFDSERWIASYGSALTITPNVLSAGFGDGYSQEVENGLNAQPESWALSWYLEPSEAEELKKWLKNGAGARRFWFLPPNYVDPIKVIAQGDIKQEFTNAGWSTVSATFLQKFDPD